MEFLDLIQKRKGVHQEKEKDRRIYVIVNSVKIEKIRNREKVMKKKEKNEESSQAKQTSGVCERSM